MKRPTRRGDEWDVTTSWRRVIGRFARAGVTSGIKRRMRRRERHEAHALELEEPAIDGSSVIAVMRGGSSTRREMRTQRVEMKRS